MAKGYIYIMTNRSFNRNIVKIGYARDVEARRKSLSTTNLPYEYMIYATYETQGNIEDKKLHKLLDTLDEDLRLNKNREFYEMSPEKAYEILEAIATISGTRDKLSAPNVEKYEEENAKNKKPPIDFYKCGIPEGAELVYVENPEVRVTVFEARKVLYNEVITSLTAIVKELKNAKHISGTSYFTYNGRLITDIAKETQWKEYI